MDKCLYCRQISITIPIVHHMDNHTYIMIRVKPTFAFDPYFECPPHLLQICSKMRPISPKTMLYQNDRVDETVVLVLNDLDMKCCP